MKKLILIIVALICMCSCTEQIRTRQFGGKMEIRLPAGQELMEATWKDDDLWYLTRPMREDEVPETHIFKADTVFGVFEGTVTIEEQAPEGAVK
jgi:hypothetical protein